MTRKKFSKPSQRGTRKFSTNLVLNENGILQSDTTPRTWRVKPVCVEVILENSNNISGN